MIFSVEFLNEKKPVDLRILKPQIDMGVKQNSDTNSKL